MNTVYRGLASRAANALLAATSVVLLFAVFSASASAINVNLRVEGATTTHFNGTVNTSARSVPGGTDDVNCRANSTAADFTEPNGLTAIADALGAAVTTSGTHYGWGVLLCSVNGEAPATLDEGWLIRINNKNATAPGGYVTATTPISEGDSVLFYMSPEFTTFSSSLDLKLPATASPGQPVTAIVDAVSHSDDSRSAADGVTLSGGGASATTGAAGSASLTFPSSGKFLVTATKSGAVRGSAWITIDPATPATPIVRVNRFVKCNRVYRKRTKKHKRCVRIVRAKQRAAASRG